MNLYLDHNIFTERSNYVGLNTNPPVKKGDKVDLNNDGYIPFLDEDVFER